MNGRCPSVQPNRQQTDKNPHALSSEREKKPDERDDHNLSITAFCPGLRGRPFKWKSDWDYEKARFDFIRSWFNEPTANLVDDGKAKEDENKKQEIERNEQVSESLVTARDGTLKIALCREKTDKQIMLEVPMKLVETTLGVIRHLCCCRYHNSRRMQARDRPQGYECVDALAPFKLIGTLFYVVWGLLCQFSTTVSRFLESCSQTCVVQKESKHPNARHGRYFHPRQGVHGWIGQEDPEKDCTAMKIFCCGKEGKNACQRLFRKTMEAFSQTEERRLSEDEVIDYFKKRIFKGDKGKKADDSKPRVLSSQREKLKTVMKKLKKPRKTESKTTEHRKAAGKVQKSPTKTRTESEISLVKPLEVRRESERLAHKNIGEESKKPSLEAVKIQAVPSYDEDEKKKLTGIKSSSFSLSSADEERNPAKEYIRKSLEKNKEDKRRRSVARGSIGTTRIKQLPPSRRSTKEGKDKRSLLGMTKDRRFSEDEKSVRFNYQDAQSGPYIAEVIVEDPARDYKSPLGSDYLSGGPERDEKRLSFKKNKGRSSSFLKFWKGHDKNADTARESTNKDAMNEQLGSGTFSDEERKKKGLSKLRNFVSGLSLSSRNNSKYTPIPTYSPPVRPIPMPLHPVAEEDEADTPPSQCEEDDGWGFKRDQLLHTLDRPAKNGNNRNNNKPTNAIEKQPGRKSADTKESVHSTDKKASSQQSTTSKKMTKDDNLDDDFNDFDIISQTSPRDSLEFVIISRTTSRSSGKQNMEERINKSLLAASIDEHHSQIGAQDMAHTSHVPPANKPNEQRERKPSRIMQLRLFQKKKPDPVQTNIILKSTRIETESFTTQDESPPDSTQLKLKNDSPSGSYSPAVSVCEKKSILKKKDTFSTISGQMSPTDLAKAMALKISDPKLSNTNGYFKNLRHTLNSIRSSLKEKKRPDSLGESRASPTESTYRKTTVSFFPIPSYSESRSSPAMSPDSFDAFKELDEEELLLLEEAKKRSE